MGVNVQVSKKNELKKMELSYLIILNLCNRSWGDVLLDIFPNLLFDSSKTEVSLREGMPRQLLQVKT